MVWKKLCQKTTMVCTAKDLLEWNNFPKGLGVLLVLKDASDIKSKLERMDYIGKIFNTHFLQKHYVLCYFNLLN